MRWWQGAVLQQRLSEPDTAALARRRAAASTDEARVRQARIAAVVCMYCTGVLQSTTAAGHDQGDQGPVGGGGRVVRVVVSVAWRIVLVAAA